MTVRVNWGERSEPCIGKVNANCVCMFISHQPTGRIAHAQKLARHMFERQELERHRRARETAEQHEIRLARRREQYRTRRLARTFCME